MKFFFSFVVLFLFFACLQIQAQVIVPDNIYRYDFNEFSWQAFVDQENIQEHIEFRNRRLSLLGAKDRTIRSINLGKSDLIRVEQELELYKLGKKTGLSTKMISLAEKAIELHWDDVNNIENQIQIYAGLKNPALSGVVTLNTPKVGNQKDYQKGAWELYKGDHKILFDLVRKKDKKLYEYLGANDELYAQFISPYVKRCIDKIDQTAKTYFNTWKLTYDPTDRSSSVDRNMGGLREIYLGSLKVYKQFNKNFNMREVHQQELMSAIKDWYTKSGLLGVKVLIDTYRDYSTISPIVAIWQLSDFYEAPAEVTRKIVEFYRKDILNNKELKMSKNENHIYVRRRALLALKRFSALNTEEQKAFNELLKKGIIKQQHSKLN